jgi:RNA polymerase-binding protein DksA
LKSSPHKKDQAGFIMKEYDSVRQQLFEMLEELDERLGKITADVQHIDEPLAQDFEEQATQTENDEVLDFLGNSARIEREMITQALARIDKGEYGICELCGETISHERLKAIPHASMCIKCASQPGC